MERVRDSDMKNKERILRDMESNAEATQRQIKRDQKILESNTQTKIDRARADGAAAQRQAEIDTAATQSMFGCSNSV